MLVSDFLSYRAQNASSQIPDPTKRFNTHNVSCHTADLTKHSNAQKRESQPSYSRPRRALQPPQTVCCIRSTTPHFSLPRLPVVSDLQLPTSASPDCLLYQIYNSPLQPPQTVCCIRSATPHFSLPRLSVVSDLQLPLLWLPSQPWQEATVTTGPGGGGSARRTQISDPRGNQCRPRALYSLHQPPSISCPPTGLTGI